MHDVSEETKEKPKSEIKSTGMRGITAKASKPEPKAKPIPYGEQLKIQKLLQEIFVATGHSDGPEAVKFYGKLKALLDEHIG